MRHAPYGWIIDTDVLYESDRETFSKSDAGTVGPSNIDPAVEARLKAGEGEPFEMYDDDGEKYYTGRLLVPDDAKADAEVEFAPLHDFGLPNAGATEIRYKDKATGEFKAI
jgi:hypothetical protein